jgi:uncharacterized phage protein gp47/JayE
MSQIPTIEDLFLNIVNDFKNKLDLSDSQFRKVIDALALSLAGQFKLSYLSLSDLMENVFPDTADSQSNGGTLERHGGIHLGRLPRPATSSIITVDIVNEVGSTLRSGLTFKSNNESKNPGKVFVLDVEKTTSSNPEQIEIRSIKGGSEYNLEIGDEITITEPVIGVESIAMVSGIVEQALSAESINDYRDAIIEAIQSEPQGGSKTDYRLWAKDAQGVKAVYPYVKDGEAGVVQIYVESTVADSLDGEGTPSQAMLDEVKSVIDIDPDITVPLLERGRRPIQATIETLPISLTPVDITVTGLNESTATIRQNIELNLKNYLSLIRPFVDGADLLRNKNDILYAARAQATVTDLIGSNNFFTSFNMSVDGVAQNSFIFSRDKVPYLRNLIFN